MVVGADAPSDIVVRDGRIVSMDAPVKRRPDYGGERSVIAPALFDIQVNGVQGVDLQSPNVTAEDVAAMTRLLAARGVS